MAELPSHYRAVDLFYLLGPIPADDFLGLQNTTLGSAREQALATLRDFEGSQTLLKIEYATTEVRYGVKPSTLYLASSTAMGFAADFLTKEADLRQQQGKSWEEKAFRDAIEGVNHAGLILTGATHPAPNILKMRVESMTNDLLAMTKEATLDPEKQELIELFVQGAQLLNKDEREELIRPVRRMLQFPFVAIDQTVDVLDINSARVFPREIYKSFAMVGVRLFQDACKELYPQAKKTVDNNASFNT